MEEREDTGVINVEWFAEPYGTVQMEARYWLYQKGSENFFCELEFVKEHFQQMYDSFLEHLFVEYSNNPLEDVWNEETGESERIEFSKKEELHPHWGWRLVLTLRVIKGMYYSACPFTNITGYLLSMVFVPSIIN